jgi:signal transduction histidine kinase
MDARGADVGRILGLACLYIVFGRLGVWLGSAGGFVSLVWPPTGISLAALLLLGIRVWPGVFIGASVTSFLTGASVLGALGIGVGNTAGALLGVYLIERVPRFSLTLENVRSATRLILAALLGTAVSASVGAACLYAGGLTHAAQLLETWRVWWIGDLVGALVVTPIVLVWSKPPRAHFLPRSVELSALAVAVVLVNVVTFFGDVFFKPGLATPFHQADVVFAVLVWSALRFGQRGAVTGAFVTSAIAVTATVLGHGPFLQGGLSQSLLSLQTFVAIGAVTFLLFGATIDERQCAFVAAREAYRTASRANRAKSDFLAVTSHELRTPLNAIAGYAQLLEDGVYGPLNEKQIQGVARIHRNEQQLLSVIDDVLGFVTAEKGRVSLRRESIRVVDAFDAVQPLVARHLMEHHCNLQRDAIGPQLAVRADRKGLQQILMRLLTNASKYSKEGGTVTLGAEREGESVRIWVHDTGVGISTKDIANVFEPFFQTEHATTRRVSGIGLGLSIARNLARGMEGEVTLSSEPGRGTTASVLLPAA